MKQTKMTNTARKLLGEHEPHSLWGDMGLRSNEGDYISHERLMEFISAYPVLDVTIDNNNYGEFQFITLKVTCFMNNGKPYTTALQFWGNGYHEYRGTLQVVWRINTGNYGIYAKNRASLKQDVLRQIAERRMSLGIRKDAKQESSGNTFEYLADLSDDDAAMIMMDDLGLD